jgi:alpha-L-fucosidase
MTDHGWIPEEITRENAAGLAKVRTVIDAGPYDDTWDSLASYEVPRWSRDGNLLVRHDGTVGAAQ